MQRAVLELADSGRPFTVDDVLDLLVIESGQSERESVLRAMRTLAAAGKLNLIRDEHGRTLSAKKPVAPKIPKAIAPPKPKGSVSLKQPARVV